MTGTCLTVHYLRQLKSISVDSAALYMNGGGTERKNCITRYFGVQDLLTFILFFLLVRFKGHLIIWLGFFFLANVTYWIMS